MRRLLAGLLMAAGLVIPPEDELATVRDYLGVDAPLAFKSQAALPVAGPVPSSPTGPTGTVPGFGGVPGARPPAPTAPQEPSRALQQALQALGMGKTTIDAIERLIASRGGGQRPETAFQEQRAGERVPLGIVAGGAQTVPSSELFFDVPRAAPEFAGARASAPPPTEVPVSEVGAPIGSTAEPAAVAGQQTAAAGAGAGTGAATGAETSGLTAADIGPYVGAALAAYNIANIAQQEGLTDEDKAAMAAGETAWTVGNIAGFGIPGIVDMIVEAAGGPSHTELAMKTFGMGPYSDYGQTRREAGQEARGGIQSLGGTYEAAARSADPAKVLQALQSGQSEGRIRSDLMLSADVAAELGLPTGMVPWSALSGDQFARLLTMFRDRPGLLEQSIAGSGDVPYLPGRAAQSVADQAAKGARELIKILIAQQAIGEASAQAAPPPAPSPLADVPLAPTGGPTGGGGDAGLGLEEPTLAELAGAM
jgi:hypothetical protein